MTFLFDGDRPGRGEFLENNRKQFLLSLLVITVGILIAVLIATSTNTGKLIETRIGVTPIQTSVTVQGIDAEFIFVFDVTAKNGDVVISNVASTDKTDPSLGLRFKFNGEAKSWVATVDHTGVNTGNNGLLVADGETERFTLTVNVKGDSNSEFVSIYISQILWEANGKTSVYQVNVGALETPEIWLGPAKG